MDTLKLLDLDLIAPDPNQPRKTFDPARITELAESMKAIGQVLPVVVKVGDPFVLIDGERRWLAAREAGITELVAVLRYEDASNTVLQQLASDHRVRLSTMERARAYAKCLEEGIERSELARVVGVSETSLSEYVRLCDLPDAIQELVDQGIPQKGALELLAIDANLAHSIATAALTHGWSAERIKLEVGKQKAPGPKASPTERKHANKVQAQLRTALRLPVRVSPTQKGGGATITITARRAVDVERLTELLLRSEPDRPSEG